MGSWAFRNRSWLPVPLACAVIVLTEGRIELRWLPALGAAVVGAGESVRLWAVRHIGVRSRTRTARTGDLVMTGPYAHMRNPLYAANWLLWTGFVIWSGLLWLLPVAWTLFALQYRAIIQWEEGRLRECFATPYLAYAARVRRWRPVAAGGGASGGTIHSWSDVLFSERGTLAAIAAMALLLIIKERMT